MMKEKLDSFFEHLSREKNFSRNTIVAYRNDLNQFNAFYASQNTGANPGHKSIHLTPRLISDYRQTLSAKKYRPATLARKVAAIRCFTKFLFEADKLPEEMEKSLVSGHVGKTLPKPLSIAEVKRLLEMPTKKTVPEAKRDRAMLELLYATGLQASELMALNLTDVDLDRGLVHCLARGSKKRDIPITVPVCKVVKEYQNLVRPDLVKESETALFVNRRGERLTRQGFWQIIKEYGDEAGLGDKVTPRVLRHSFAIHKCRSGIELSEVQKMLGHAYLTSTKVYEKV